MAKFYFEKLIVSGPDKEDSIVEFKEGLNYIIGPSNTGKTTIIKCIDYLLGFRESKDRPFDFDEATDYDRFTLVVRTKAGTVVLQRKLGDSKVLVSGTDPDFEHGDYTLTKSAKLPLNKIWLQLMGIKDTHNVLRTIKGDLQQISLRTMLHMFLIKQEDIARASSVLLRPKSFYNDTPSKSSLLFLMSGRDADKKDTQEEKKIRRAKRLAVIEYIKDSVGKLLKRESELLEIRNENDFDIDSAITVIGDEIEALQSQINDSIAKSKSLMEQIYSHNSKLAECATITERFNALRSQCHSDVERLTFIIEGSLAQNDLPPNRLCPFCEGEIEASNESQYIEAARAELNHIRVHLIELRKAENDVCAKTSAIKTAVEKLEADKRTVDMLVLTDLTPRINTLHTKLRDYRKAVELSKELGVIQDEERRLNEEATNLELQKDIPDERQDIIHFFDEDMIFSFNERLKAVLEACNYEGSSSARLNLRETFDLEVGGKPKAQIAGGGYSGFLNTIVALALTNFLEYEGAYSPGFLIADSPLSQLSEPDGESLLNTKKAGFFNYLLNNTRHNNNSDYRPQIIIAEHPENLPCSIENSQRANIIRFTGNIDAGRYGFLNDVFN